LLQVVLENIFPGNEEQTDYQLAQSERLQVAITGTNIVVELIHIDEETLNVRFGYSEQFAEEETIDIERVRRETLIKLLPRRFND
jgi:hypothetical protein